MRKHYFFILGLGSVLLFCQSCSKESAIQSSGLQANLGWVNTINVKLAPNELYQLPIDHSSTISITKQASHYKLSQIAADTKSSAVIYSYLPAVDYSGEDEVMITVNNESSVGAPRCSNGSSSSSSSSTTLIKVKVGNY